MLRLAALLAVATVSSNAGADSWRHVRTGMSVFIAQPGFVCKDTTQVQRLMGGKQPYGCSTWKIGTRASIIRWVDVPVSRNFAATIATVRSAAGIEGVIPIATLLPVIPKGTRVMVSAASSPGSHATLAVVVGQLSNNVTKVRVYIGGIQRIVSVYDLKTLTGNPVHTLVVVAQRR